MTQVDKEGPIQCFQINAASRSITHDMMMMWLAGTTKPTIMCVQEPFLLKKGFCRLPKGYECFWSRSVRKINSEGIEPKPLQLQMNDDTTRPTALNEVQRERRVLRERDKGSKFRENRNKSPTNISNHSYTQYDNRHEDRKCLNYNEFELLNRSHLSVENSSKYKDSHNQAGKCSKIVSEESVSQNNPYEMDQIAMHVDGKKIGVEYNNETEAVVEVKKRGRAQAIRTGKRRKVGVNKIRLSDGSRGSSDANGREHKPRETGIELKVDTPHTCVASITPMGQPHGIIPSEKCKHKNGMQDRVNLIMEKGIELEVIGLNTSASTTKPTCVSYNGVLRRGRACNGKSTETLFRERKKKVISKTSTTEVKRRRKYDVAFCELNSIGKRVCNRENQGDKGICKGNAGESKKSKCNLSVKRLRVRALIVASKSLCGYMVSQFSDVDCVIVRFDCLTLSVSSLYCDINVPIHESICNICKKHVVSKNMVICADTNAHCVRWGALGNKVNRFKSYKRGEVLCEYIDELDLEVCNITPHLPTYTGDTGHVTHIDATLYSSKIAKKISNWRVCIDQFESDHRPIQFNLCVNVPDDVSNVKVSQNIPWLRPSDNMIARMEECLPKMVRYKRRVGKEDDVDLFVQKHTNEVNEALQRICKKNKDGNHPPCYWWTKEVSILHKQMKVARRRMHRYKYNNLAIEYNMCRKKFRDKVKEVKISSWKEFTSNIDDPWKGLMKILTKNDMNKALNRTLCSTIGVYAVDMKETLCLLGEQFFPKQLEYTNVHKSMEEEVNLMLSNDEEGEEITVCEFRKALNEMKKATAPGSDLITNSVLHILAKKCKFEQMYIRIFNTCLRKGIFPAAWKQGKIVLIPKVCDEIDSVKAARPITLTSVFSKLLERIVLARVLHYIKLSGNLVISQHAYRKGGSTTTALFETSKFIQDTLNDKHVCISVFLDISGAFDRTWHGGILYRLLQYGVHAYLVKWIKCFLSDRNASFQAAGKEHAYSYFMVFRYGDGKLRIISSCVLNLTERSENSVLCPQDVSELQQMKCCSGS